MMLLEYETMKNSGLSKISSLFIAITINFALQATPVQAEVKLAIDESYFEIAPYIVSDFEAAYTAIGESLIVDIIPGSRAIIAANAGQYTAIDARFKGSSLLTNMIPIDVPIYANATMYAWTANPSITINNMVDLNRYSVAIVRDCALCLTLMKEADIEVTVIDTLTQAMQMVDSKRIDILVSSDFILRLNQQKGIGNGLIPVSPALGTAWVYHHVHKNRSDLVPALEKTIRELKADGLFTLR